MTRAVVALLLAGLVALTLPWAARAAGPDGSSGGDAPRSSPRASSARRAPGAPEAGGVRGPGSFRLRQPPARFEHFSSPEFLRLRGTIERPPELGVPVKVALRCEVSETAGLPVTLSVKLPRGVELRGALPRPGTRVDARRPLEVEFRLVVRREVARGRVEFQAATPYPVKAAKSYFLSRIPLYSPKARQEYARFVSRPPARYVARHTLAFRTSAAEASLGATSTAALHAVPSELPFALRPVSCEALPPCKLDWKALLRALGAGTLPSPEGWCRLHAMALAKLREGRPSAAEAVLRALVAGLERAPGFSEHRPSLVSNLAVALAIQGRVAEALSLWASVPGRETNAHVAFNEATCLQGRPNPLARKQAGQAYRKALALSPGYTLARRRLEALERPPRN